MMFLIKFIWWKASDNSHNVIYYIGTTYLLECLQPGTAKEEVNGRSN